jgi:hypothetical protein
MRSSIFWDITPCSPLKVNRRLGITSRRHRQIRRRRQARNLHERRWQNGGDMFLRNVGWLSTDYTTLYPRRTFYNYLCENLRSYTGVGTSRTLCMNCKEWTHNVEVCPRVSFTKITPTLHENGLHRLKQNHLSYIMRNIIGIHGINECWSPQSTAFMWHLFRYR